MSLYFIRHGQTKLNVQHKFNGGIDEELSETGVMQATKAAEGFKDVNIDVIYCSPLKRTRHTLKCLNLPSNVPVIYDERLVERKEGALAGTEIDDEILHNVYLNRFTDVRIDGLETVDEVFNRVHQVIDEIKEKHQDKNVLIVAHGFVGRAVYFYFNAPPENGLLWTMQESFPLNCEIRKFEFDREDYKDDSEK